MVFISRTKGPEKLRAFNLNLETMTRNQRSRLRMYQTLRALLEEEQAALGALPAMADPVQRFNNSVDGILNIGVEQATRITGIAAGRREERNRMNGTLLKIAKALESMAIRTGDTELHYMVHVTPSVLRACSEDRHRNVRELVLQQAQIHLAALPTYGVQQQDVDDLESAMAVYQQLVVAPRMAVVKRQGKTRQLQTLFAEATRVLKQEIDPLMLVLASGNAALGERYLRARRIVDLGYRATDDPNTGQA
jgi:hypothetical protein